MRLLRTPLASDSLISWEGTPPRPYLARHFRRLDDAPSACYWAVPLFETSAPLNVCDKSRKAVLALRHRRWWLRWIRWNVLLLESIAYIEMAGMIDWKKCVSTVLCSSRKDFSIGTVPVFCTRLKHCIWLNKQRLFRSSTKDSPRHILSIVTVCVIFVMSPLPRGHYKMGRDVRLLSVCPSVACLVTRPINGEMKSVSYLPKGRGHELQTLYR